MDASTSYETYHSHHRYNTRGVAQSQTVSMKRKQSTTSLTESMQSDMSTMEWAAVPDSTASTPDTPHQAEETTQFHTYYSHSEIIDADVWDQLLDVLKSWRKELYRLQPLVEVEDIVLEGALVIVKSLSTSSFYTQCFQNPDYLAAYAAAALWLCTKQLGCRTKVPNRTLISRATQQHPDALSAYEVQVCHAFDWDISSALRSEGVI